MPPTPIKKKQMQEVLDKEGRPVLNENGGLDHERGGSEDPPGLRRLPSLILLRTVGDPIDLMVPEELKEAVNDYDLFMEAITAVSHSTDPI